MNQIAKKEHKSFEDIRQKTKEGQDFWSARDLQTVLEYKSWDKFKSVIAKAIRACKNSGNDPFNHFSQLGKMVKIGSGAERHILDYDYHLTRYACYLIVQNGDSSKPVIASGQTYFAIQTRRQELADDKKFKELNEDEKRLFLRNEIKSHNKQLVETASKAGVKSSLDFAVFQNHGYKGLYSGLTAKNIHKRKELKKGQNILDYMGSTELAANLFRATQTEEKLNRDNIREKKRANQTHYEVGKKVRKTIKELGGVMPENLQKPKGSIKLLEKHYKKKLSNKNKE